MNRPPVFPDFATWCWETRGILPPPRQQPAPVPAPVSASSRKPAPPRVPTPPPFRPHATGVCPPGQILQINGMTNVQVCAPPGSVPRFLAATNTWVMVPSDWVLIADPRTGRTRYAPPPRPY